MERKVALRYLVGVLLLAALLCGGYQISSGAQRFVTPTSQSMFMATVVASSTPTITPSPLPTATNTPLPTFTPTPSPTPTPEVWGTWVLSLEQRVRLQRSALMFLADTEREAIRIAHNLEFVPGYGHPSNMCGPLTVAILHDAGLIDQTAAPADFWLLNPQEPLDANLLENTFPEDRYLWFNTLTPLNAFDFEAFPLQPGDFLYLIAGSGGTFEHVLVVTRMDEAGRAYSVTNIKVGEVFLIQEILLYDPTEPGVGMFYEWTDPTHYSMGMTGTGGFYLWRYLAGAAPQG